MTLLLDRSHHHHTSLLLSDASEIGNSCACTREVSPDLSKSFKLLFLCSLRQENRRGVSKARNTREADRVGLGTKLQHFVARRNVIETL